MRITAVLSGLTKFHYDFLDERGQSVGALDFPTGLAVSEGSRLPAAIRGHVRFELPLGPCELHFTREGRDLRFSLMREGQPIATAAASGRQLSVSCQGRELRLERKFSLLRLRFEVHEGGRCLGSIYEPDFFSLVRRRFSLALPLEVTDETRALLFFLVVNSVFR